MNLNCQKILETYQIRWSIEFFFKECKQYLHLSSCSSNTFDAQIAHVSLVLMRYIVLTYCKILNYQLSFGDLLSALSRERLVLDLVSRLILILGHIMKKMSDASDFDACELYISIVRSPDLREEVLKLAGLLEKE